jgi:hypothetical protein
VQEAERYGVEDDRALSGEQDAPTVVVDLEQVLVV